MSRSLIALVAMTAVAHAQGTEPAPDVAPMPAEDVAPAEDALPAEDATPAPAEDAAPALAQDVLNEPAAEPAADTAAADRPAAAPPDMSDQGIAATLGAAVGGRTTAGGLRVAGHYLYQLADQDWFDGTAAFVFGSGEPDCFRDRMDDVICEHGLADGYAVELSANVRRFLGGNEQFWPFARAGIGVAVVRFADDGITGVAFPLHLGGGLRVSVSEGIALIGQAELDLGLAVFGSGPGLEPQLGLNVSAGAEFRL